ncbi:MAG: hypothetical protein HS111_18585 [Kofleriaceae bacterium]|nr:hypothetical protein [Kofleriaceae bacterium]
MTRSTSARGSNATVANVRASLERKAGELFASSQKPAKTQPDEAKSLLRTITKIVPADSPWYIRSYKILNQRKGRGRRRGRVAAAGGIRSRDGRGGSASDTPALALGRL